MNPDLLARLRDPACYPNAPETVEIIQTHLSVVCIAGGDVYKLKKPVKFSFVDFSSLERRQYYCEEELRLNRRLCPHLYREVVPLYQTGPSSWSFMEKSDTIVDYAVLMHYLPEELMMDEVLERDEVTAEQIVEIATRVSRFHQESREETGPIPKGIPDNLRAAVFGNFEATEAHAGAIFDSTLYEAHRQAVSEDFERLYPQMVEREQAGLVVDGHGDLHARNICLTSPISIFDCIEFRPQFRILDQATENAFMIMDLIRRGHPDFARLYLKTYCETSGDAAQSEVLPSLISYRAMVRAKVNAMTASDKDVDEAERERAKAEAQGYLRLSVAALLSHHSWFLMGCGLPGAGKSYLLEKLAQETGWPCISSDRVRKELAGVPPQERLDESFYSPEFSQRTYGEILERASEHSRHDPVLVDANFINRKNRARGLEAARKTRAIPLVVWFDAPDSLIRERLESRAEEGNSVSDADVAVYEKLRLGFEAPNASEGFQVVRITTDSTPETALNQLFGELLKLRPN